MSASDGRCTWQPRVTGPVCSEPGDVVTVGCIHEHIYRACLCTRHQARTGRCLDCFKSPVRPHRCDLLIRAARQDQPREQGDPQ